MSTGKVKAVKLLSTSGAYWRVQRKKQDVAKNLWNFLSKGKSTR